MGVMAPAAFNRALSPILESLNSVNRPPAPWLTPEASGSPPVLVSDEERSPGDERGAYPDEGRNHPGQGAPPLVDLPPIPGRGAAPVPSTALRAGSHQEISPRMSPSCADPSEPGNSAAKDVSLTSVWSSIQLVVPQLKAMQAQQRTSMALIKVMSAITLEASDVWEAERVESLCRHLAALQELLSSDTLPEESAVLGVLSDLKVSRIRTMAKAALSYKQLKATAKKGVSNLTFRSALGLPSLQLRKKETKVKAVDDRAADGEAGEGSVPPMMSPAILEQVQLRAAQYTSGFSAIAKRHASRQAAVAAKAASVSCPTWLPALPKQRPKKAMNARHRAQAQVDEATWKASCSVLLA